MNNEWKELPTILSVAQAIADGWEIEFAAGEGWWCPWAGKMWKENTLYRGRPKSPAKLIVTSEGWRHKNSGDLTWRRIGEQVPVAWYDPENKDFSNVNRVGWVPLYASTVPRADVQDDARYNYLRNSSNWPAVFSSSYAPEPLRGEELDAAIDAVLRD